MSRKKKEQTTDGAILPESQSETLVPSAEAEEAIQVLSEDVARLNSELETTRAKMDEYLQGWQRALADFSNYKRRVERDQTAANQAAAGSIIKRYLDIVDDLDRALQNRPQQGEGANWANGIELIYRKLLTILDTEGVKIIEASGQEFDPALHEAISMEESQEFASGMVIGVLQQGYTLGDRVLRPARVRVAR